MNKNNNQNIKEQTGNIKKGRWKRFLERLAKANREYPGGGCRS